MNRFRSIEILVPEIETYKVKLENMFSDTDIKNEKNEIIFELLRIGWVWTMDYLPSENWYSNAMDDYGRHTEMALKINVKNSYYNFRNEIFPLQFV